VWEGDFPEMPSFKLLSIVVVFPCVADGFPHDFWAIQNCGFWSLGEWTLVNCAMMECGKVPRQDQETTLKGMNRVFKKLPEVGHAHSPIGHPDM
jgi:hypothetical protein